MPNGTIANDRFRESSDGGDCCTVNQMVAILENHSQKTATVYSHGDEFREHDGQSAGRLQTPPCPRWHRGSAEVMWRAGVRVTTDKY